MSKTHLRVTVGSHGFTCDRLTPRGQWLCMDYAKRFIQYAWIKKRGFSSREVVNIFASVVNGRKEFRFHISCLGEFKTYLEKNYNGEHLTEWVHLPQYEPVKVNLPIRAGWTPRDDQVPAIEYLVKPYPVSRLIGMQTGFGKTACACFALSKLGVRTVILIKPGYIDKWEADIKKMFDIPEDATITVTGSAELKALFTMAKEGRLDASIIIISSRTYMNYLKEYEQFGEGIIDQGWDCLPGNMFEHLGAGIRLIDEVHQEFHLMFKLDLYTHVPGSMSLSATLMTQNEFIRRMHRIAYPLYAQYVPPPLKRYIDCFAVYYSAQKPEKIRTEEYGGRGYSHTAFEQSIVKHPPTLNNYLKLLDETIQYTYFHIKRPKKKLLIFASRMAMCTLMAEYLQKKYPHLDVRRYVAADDYLNVLDADICVSTLGSAGTAIDIKDLTSVILTVAVNSIQANIQCLGRLRELPDSDVRFSYLNCTSIEKHMQYDQEKQEMFKNRVRSIKPVYSQISI